MSPKTSVSRAKALPAKRSKKGYEEENDKLHKELLVRYVIEQERYLEGSDRLDGTVSKNSRETGNQLIACADLPGTKC